MVWGCTWQLLRQRDLLCRRRRGLEPALHRRAVCRTSMMQAKAAAAVAVRAATITEAAMQAAPVNVWVAAALATTVWLAEMATA